MSVLFLGHGAPTLAFDRNKGADIAAIRPMLGEPRALLVVSAHWEAPLPTLGAVEPRPLVYDFSGFSEPLYHVSYPAPGAPDLARRVQEIAGPLPLAPERGWDHGVWTPLLHLFPAHDVPILQLSLGGSPRALFDLGQRLAPLARDGVCIVGSGNLVHNLRRVSFHEREPPPGWAILFDAWVVEMLAARDYDALVDFERLGPHAALAHPTHEHFLPALFVAGAAKGCASGPPSFPVTGFEFGNVDRRCVLWS
jgi:4,5-DOPA dioxygenase extradiol